MKKLIILFFIFILSSILIVAFMYTNSSNNKLPDFTNKSISLVEEYCKEHTLKLEITEEYSSVMEKDHVISQSINSGIKVKAGDTLNVIVSLGQNLEDLYKEYRVNELGNVPIMMYHGIEDISDNRYTGGNIDSQGYQRTAKAFREDLDFYYQNGYRMIRLNDYINGTINVKLGYSPIVITFDDGLSNNIKVTGRDEFGDIIIDPNSAIGILEEYKSKYPDFGVTATFFINNSLFNQSEYNEDILNWLIEHNYDIGNHTSTHESLAKTNSLTTIKEVGSMYQRLENIIGDKYIPVVALPFGEPYSKKHDNFKYILAGNYNNFSYKTEATLRVGWESELSPFHTNFDKTYLKRIRAYDNNGVDFDIKHNFTLLEKNRYISDGNVDTVVVPEQNKDRVNTNLRLILY